MKSKVFTRTANKLKDAKFLVFLKFIFLYMVY